MVLGHLPSFFWRWPGHCWEPSVLLQAQIRGPRRLSEAQGLGPGEARRLAGFGDPCRASEVLGGGPACGVVLFKNLEKSGNLGRQPETRKGIKLGGCLRKQGVGKMNQTLGLLGTEDVPSQDMPPPPHPWVCRGAISTCYLQPPRSKTP